jgi:hypothetical protein
MRTYGIDGVAVSIVWHFHGDELAPIFGILKDLVKVGAEKRVVSKLASKNVTGLVVNGRDSVGWRG